LHPRWRQGYELPQAPVLVELDLDALLQRPVPAAKTLPRHPAALRDLAVVVGEGVTHDALMAAVSARGKGTAAGKVRVLTHCNAGALATAGHGTALGVIRSAVAAGKRISVIADETRPFLQGARLTAWEMIQEKIPVTLITDNMAGHLMAQGEIDAVVVGTDRVAANGDVANKIGTYMVAVLAHRHRIPFYVACPLSTIDLSVRSGREIPIEERSPQEVTGFRETQWAAPGVQVRNPSFDITPAELVTALITEKGVVEAPDANKLRALFS
jgi:methylthioribose-1-phosphate isomerase